MVGFFAVLEFHVEVCAGFVGECLKELLAEGEVEVADVPVGGMAEVGHEVWAVGEVYGDAHEGFVHREDEEAVAVHAGLVADGLLDGLPEDDADVFYGVVVVDVYVALGLDLEVENAVARKKFEHVVEERYARVDFVIAGTVEIDFEFNLGFLGVAYNFCRSVFHKCLFF